MMSENQQAGTGEPKSIPFGARLQSAREALGLESKDAAAQLRLNERVIQLMEKDCYSTGLHPTFIRGYLRAYGKLLQIPEHEIKLAIEPIKPSTSIPAPIEAEEEPRVLTSSNYFMQIFTSLIVVTLVGLVGIWWYTHSPKHAQNEQPANLTNASGGIINLPIAANTDVSPLPTRVEPPSATKPTAAGVQVQAQVQAPTPVPSAQPVAPSTAKETAQTNDLNKAKKAAPAQEENDTDEYEDD